MNPSAKVHSIDLLKRLQAALARFGVDAQTALGVGDGEIRRVHAALEERGKFWSQQVNRRQEEVAQARSALAHARAMHEGKKVGCVEQELALRKAQERLREAEGKVVAVRRWKRDLPEVLKDYEAAARALSGFIETDLRQAVALLEAKVAALEAYLDVKSEGKIG
jgi:hypothetical protein